MKMSAKREINHIIKVKSRSNPINIMSYRYSHHQKPKIKRIDQIFLKCGIISKSRSPYVAPMVLV